MSTTEQVFSKEKYILLETYKKNGETKATTVWFIVENGSLFFHTSATSWKAKRLYRNPKVRITPCSFFGKSKGQSYSGNASLVKDKDESKRLIKLVLSKYELIGKILGVIERNRVVFSIGLEQKGI